MSLDEFVRALGLRPTFAAVCELPSAEAADVVLRAVWRGRPVVVVRVDGGYAIRWAREAHDRRGR